MEWDFGGRGIASSAAAGNVRRNTGIGWADSGDGRGVNGVANSVELKYALYGDTNLNGLVDIFDLNNLLPHYNHSGDWTGGDVTYSGNVDIFDLNAMLPNYNTSPGSQVAEASDASVALSGADAGTAPVSTPSIGSVGASDSSPAFLDGRGLAARRKRHWVDRPSR